MPYSDVYMLAKAKNRLNDIFKIYTILKDNNLKPNLLLAGVDIQDQKYKDEITYLNKSIPYEENLQYIFHTHCILEVMQKNGIGFTQRACEAVCLGKKLLTNNPHTKMNRFSIWNISLHSPLQTILTPISSKKSKTRSI